jgi:hypothetical protein
MKEARILMLLMFSLAVSCSHDLATINDARETVFRYQFGRTADYYCIGLDSNSDPSDEFLKRFEGNTPPVKKYSECEPLIGSLSDRFRDKSGKIIVLYVVHSVKRTASGTAIVEASWDAAPLRGETHRYTMKQVDGKWIITKDEITVVS